MDGLVDFQNKSNLEFLDRLVFVDQIDLIVECLLLSKAEIVNLQKPSFIF